MVSKDDSISFKANSTDITVTDSLFINGLGIAIGSIGQYKDQFETIERIKADNIRFKNTLHAVGVFPGFDYSSCERADM